MAKKPPHYVVRKGIHAYWMPTPTMRAMGFQAVPCGHDGPEAKAIAYEWEARYQRARQGGEAEFGKVYPPKSVGAGFAKFKTLQAWKGKAPRTREDWERGWKFIAPVFGDMAPSAVTLEMLDQWYARVTAVKGAGEAGRALKIWRALYTVLAALRLCQAGQDPSLGIRKATIAGRTQTWRQFEVVRLCKAAWRSGHRGLACIMAIAWDTSFAPVDVRTLTPSQAVTSGQDIAFLTDRTKTGVSAYGTLSRRTERMVRAYLAGLDYTLHEDAPIFRTKGYAPTGKGGRPRNSVPYTKDSLIDDFADLRRAVFGKDERRRLMDMRRSGAVEANAGGASVESMAAKMGNSIDQNKTLQRTYMPVNLAAVRAADDARKIGRTKLGAEQNSVKKLKLSSGGS